jgi:hypothetical protein
MGQATSWVNSAAGKVTKTITGMANKVHAWMYKGTFMEQTFKSRIARNIGATPLLRVASYVRLADRAWSDTETYQSKVRKALALARKQDGTKQSIATQINAQAAKKIVAHVHGAVAKKKKKKKKLVSTQAVAVGGCAVRVNPVAAPVQAQEKAAQSKERAALELTIMEKLKQQHQEQLKKQSWLQKAKRVAKALAYSFTIDNVSDMIGDPLQERADRAIIGAFGVRQGWRAALNNGVLMRKFAQYMVLDTVGTTIGMGSSIVASITVGVLTDLASKLLGWQ